MTKATLWFDGNTHKTNPGPAAGGAYLELENGETFEYAEFIAWATNNEAEYLGLINGLEGAVERGVTELQVYGDSKLIIYQVNGHWRCHKPHLQSYLDRAKEAKRPIQKCQLKWIPREKNEKADSIANNCLEMWVNKLARPKDNKPVWEAVATVKTIQNTGVVVLTAEVWHGIHVDIECRIKNIPEEMSNQADLLRDVIPNRSLVKGKFEYKQGFCTVELYSGPEFQTLVSKAVIEEPLKPYVPVSKLLRKY